MPATIHVYTQRRGTCKSCWLYVNKKHGRDHQGEQPRKHTYKRIVKVLPACPEREGHNMHRMHAGQADNTQTRKVKAFRTHLVTNICHAKPQFTHTNTLARLLPEYGPRR